MSQVPSDLRYTKTHEWVKLDDEGLAIVGITDHAQCLLGDLVFVELPELDTDLLAAEEAGVIESVKAASDLYSPLQGQVVAVNEALRDNPQLVNEDPFGEGWIFKLSLTNADDLQDLLEADDYQDLLASDEA